MGARTIQNAWRCSMAHHCLRKEIMLLDERLLCSGMADGLGSLTRGSSRCSLGLQGISGRDLNSDREDGDEVQKPPEEGTLGADDPHMRGIATLKRWAMAKLTRCFMNWKKWILILHDKVQMGQSAIKNLVHGEVYSFFRKWVEIFEAYGDSVTPRRSFPGQLVGLSKDGREYEFLHGERLEGDTECGVLLEPVLSNKSVWTVKWLSTGKKGTYLCGSMNRYHLRLWKVEDVGRGTAGNAADEQQGFSSIQEALLQGQGHKMSMNVTAPFGGTITMPCPRDSPWSISCDFPARCVHVSVMMQVQGIEASAFDAAKLAFGSIVSAVVQVKPRQSIQCFKSYSLSIPHRAVAISVKSLALYFWPENRSGAERIVHNVSFNSDYCTAEVDVFGIFCVLATAPRVEEVVFAKLKFDSEGRDVTGKQLTSVSMSTSFKGVVTLYPKAFLDPPVGLPVPTSSLWMTMPRFAALTGILLESVKLSFATKMDVLTLTSWSGRAKWRGRPLRMDFEGIVQPVAGKSVGNKTPLVLCQCMLVEEGTDSRASINFNGPHCFRMQIKVMYASMYIHIYLYINTYICMRMYMYICLCMYTNIYLYIYIYVYIYIYQYVKIFI